MKKTLIIIIVVGLILALGRLAAQAQSMEQTYKAAVGVKVWPDVAGVTVKYFINPKAALEGVGYFWGNGIRTTALYEFHFALEGAPGFRWYVGPGAHIGVYNQNYRDRYGNQGTGGALVGVDGVIGMEYKFRGAPIALSLDWQPSVGFGNSAGFEPGWGGIGVKYCF